MPTPKKKSHKFRQRRKRQGKRRPSGAKLQQTRTVNTLIVAKVEPLEKRILAEDISKLRDFGLSEHVCSLLSRQGIPTVCILVERLKAGQKLSGIGEARMYEIRVSLANCNVTI